MKIVSGGQTGVDRAALDWAIAQGVAHGGWCPRGRLAEDGRIPYRYWLRETESAGPEQRTERNVIDSDATLIIARRPPLTGGTLLAQQTALANGKHVWVVFEADDFAASAAHVRTFLGGANPQVLNVAGPRESEEPGLGAFVQRVLEACLGGPAGGDWSAGFTAPRDRR